MCLHLLTIALPNRNVNEESKGDKDCHQPLRDRLTLANRGQGHLLVDLLALPGSAARHRAESDRRSQGRRTRLNPKCCDHSHTLMWLNQQWLELQPRLEVVSAPPTSAGTQVSDTRSLRLSRRFLHR